MSTVKQVGLLPAGCQPWNNDVCAACGDRFAYSATLAVYIFEYDRQYNDFRLQSIMSEHKKTITAISWNSKNPDLLASSSADNQIVIYNIANQHVVARLESTRGTPSCVGWCPHEKDCVSFINGKGPLYLWNHMATGMGLSTHKDAQSFNSDVCQFRWHTKKMGKIVFGHANGSISIICPGQKSQRHVLQPEEAEDGEEDDPVVSLEWDPLSTDYLIMVNSHYGIRLVDSQSLSVIQKFQLPSMATQVHTLAWINSAPGMFITGDTQSGVIRIWSVAKQTPIENIKLKKTGFHALQVFTTAPSLSNLHPVATLHESPRHMSSTMEAVGPAKVSSSYYALPHAHALCTFLDGGVGLYDLGKRKWNFLREQGHVETIFDCKFKPDNYNLLATGSFDGTIKVWDINTLKPVYTSPGNEGVIYSLSWAPADLNCLVASTSRQGAFIWDLNKGKIIKRFMEHGKSAVYSVAWNHKDSQRILSAGADGYCIIRRVDGKVLMKYRHPSAVYGCDWSPHNKDMLATGCEDKCVRVFYMATNSDQPLKVFSGHTAKVFHVKWSPLRDGILCSGSDDTTVRIWDYTQDTCTNILQGHTAPVRGLLWSLEIPYLFISGSWDYSIRIWDTRDGACLDTVLDHGADVYGLTCHPDRPFVMASCSRDSTVRIWSLTPLVQPLQMNIIAERSWNEIITPQEMAMEPGAPPLLTGKASKDLKVMIDKMPSHARSRSLIWFSKFFSSPGGTDNLWELISIINGMDDTMLSEDYRKGIMHIKHLTKYKAGEAQEVELSRISKLSRGTGREDTAREAAQLHIRLGNVQRYCELMAEVGDWEKALSVAPAVSLKYWRDLAERRAKSLMREENDDIVPYCVASGEIRMLVDHFTKKGNLKDAMLVAAAAHEGTMAPPSVGRPHRGSVNGVQNGQGDDDMQLVQDTSKQFAEWQMIHGTPTLAACCHLAMDDCKGALQKLIRGNEIELAVCAGLILGSKVSDLTYVAIELLARRCEKLGRWDLAVDLLKMIPDSDLELAKLCARCAASMAEINDIHAKAGYPSMDDCLKEAERLRGKKDVVKIIKYYLMSTSPEVGLDIGLAEVKARMSVSGWKCDHVFGLLHLLACIQTEKLQQHKCAKYRHELLVLSSYVGALVAIRRKYCSIVEPLFVHTKKLMARENADLPISISLIDSELSAWKASDDGSVPNSNYSMKKEMTREQLPIYEALIAKAGPESSPVGVGPVIVTGANFPSHSDVHFCCLTGQRIQGHAFFLEDGRSAIALSDAIMWAKVNPFSPTGSGIRLNPF